MHKGSLLHQSVAHAPRYPREEFSYDSPHQQKFNRRISRDEEWSKNRGRRPLQGLPLAYLSRLMRMWHSDRWYPSFA